MFHVVMKVMYWAAPKCAGERETEQYLYEVNFYNFYISIKSLPCLSPF